MRIVRDILFFLVVAALAVYLGLMLYERLGSDEDLQAQNWTCDADARICPDGSSVGRTGPDCEFAACPGIQSAPGGLEDQSGGILIGTVNVLADVYAMQGDRIVASTRTTVKGEYTLDLPAGDYTLRAVAVDSVRICADVETIVIQGVRSSENIVCAAR